MKKSDLVSVKVGKEGQKRGKEEKRQEDSDSRTSGPGLCAVVAALHASKQLKAKSRSFSRKRGDCGEFDLTHEWSPEDFINQDSRFRNRQGRARTLTMCAARPFETEPVRKFQEHKVEVIIKEVFESNLAEREYDPGFCQHASVQMAEIIKERVKRLRYARYKLVCHVAMGDIRRQGVRIASRCAWDSTVDGFAQYRFQNLSLYATVFLMDRDSPSPRRPEQALKAATWKESARLKEQPHTVSVLRKHKEADRMQGQKSENLGSLRLPSLTSNNTSTGLLRVPSPPPSPAKLTVSSHPRLERRRKSDLGPLGTGVAEELLRTRRGSSSELPGRTANHYTVVRPATSPKLLRRRQTASASVMTSRSRKLCNEDLGSGFPQMRRQSEGIVPTIQINQSQENLQERVRKFNQTLEKCAAKLRRDSYDEDARRGDEGARRGDEDVRCGNVEDSRWEDEESQTTTDDLSTTPRPAISRSRSLPSLIPVINNNNLKNESAEPLTLYEDLLRCRYLRIPGSPEPLTVEQIFQKN